MKNENSEDNLFSGLKKICKPMDSKLISKVNSKEIQSNKIHFDLDFLNSIVDKGNISNKNNNFLYLLHSLDPKFLKIKQTQKYEINCLRINLK